MTTPSTQVYLARIRDEEESEASSINGIFTTMDKAKTTLTDFAQVAFEDYKKPLSFGEWDLSPNEDDIFTCIVSDAEGDQIGQLRIDQVPLDSLVAIDNDL